MSAENKFDVIIIGGGPAALTAAIYATRRNLTTLVVAKAIGGQITIASEIENYPGFESVSGFELADKFRKHAEKTGAQFVSSEVVAIEKITDGFRIKTASQEYNTISVILAFGLTPRSLNVPGEDRLIGRGVTYCATCDGPFYKGKTVGVVGSGNSAFDAAAYLSGLAEKVYLITFSEKYTAFAALVDRVKTLPNIEIVCCETIKEINGENKVESITLTGPTATEIKLDGLFIEIGYQAKTDWLKGLVELNDRGEIITEANGATSLPGIFAAGDCSDVGYKQIVIAAGEGAKSALEAYKYVSEKTGKAIIPDWGKKK